MVYRFVIATTARVKGESAENRGFLPGVGAGIDTAARPDDARRTRATISTTTHTKGDAVDLDEEVTMTRRAWHRKQAVDLFNGTWDLIEKADRTREETTLMVHMAHASRYHWNIVGEPVNFGRGEWQVSRVCALAGLTDAAIFHGENYLRIAQDSKLKPFDLGFAHEALARAYSVAGDKDTARAHVEQALEAAKGIEEADEKKLLTDDLTTIAI